MNLFSLDTMITYINTEFILLNKMDIILAYH